MSNRCYLYSTNFVPGTNVPSEQRRITGIAEWSVHIPTAFHLLLSANPRVCSSLIWDVPEKIAIVGDYNAGCSALFRYLDAINQPEIALLCQEAKGFLQAESNKGPFFVLECGEIFEYSDEPLEEQNLQLLDEIQHASNGLDNSIAFLNSIQRQEVKPKPKGFLSRIFGTSRREPEPPDQLQEAILELGLGNWSNVLYCDPNEKEEDAPSDANSTNEDFDQ